MVEAKTTVILTLVPIIFLLASIAVNIILGMMYTNCKNANKTVAVVAPDDAVKERFRDEFKLRSESQSQSLRLF